MKFYAALLAVLMVGIAVGQTCVDNAGNDCKLKHGSNGKWEAVISKPVPKKSARPTNCIDVNGNPVYPPKCFQEKEAQKPAKVAAKSEPVWTWYKTDLPRGYESLDVPAIQVATRLGCDTTGETSVRGCMDHPVPVYSCKDKSRILEHDESTPPKYWCRKVQQ